MLKLLDWRSRALGLGSLALGVFLMMVGCARKPFSDRELWAEVDGQPIFRDQVERIYRSRATTGSEANDPDQALSFKLSILDELINNQILVAHALRSGLTVSEAEVDTQIAELQSPYSKEEFERKLRERRLEVADLRQDIRQNVLLNKLLNKEIASRSSLSEADLTAYYERNKSNFNIPETQYHLSQIEVTPGEDPDVRNLKNDDAKNPTLAERKIQALYARLRAGEDFATVAQEYSEDPRTAAGGGDMGFIPASALDSSPQLKQAISSLKPGQFSPIIRTPRGFHIVKLLGIEESGQRLLSDPKVQTAIRKMLTNEKEQLFKAATIEVLRNRAKVVNFLAEKIVTKERAAGTGK